MPLPRDDAVRQIAVIGAGPAGLVAAKTLREAGFEVTVFEAGSHVGGTWVYDNDNGRRFLYRRLHLNTARRYTRFSDFDFPAGTPDFPGHADVHRYLVAYAERFGLLSHVRFRSPVDEVAPADGGGWRVRTHDATAERFDAVVVCTSPFHHPRHPEDLKVSFAGAYLHAADYREPAPYQGKRVCVIGAGNSAVDIASDLCGSAARTVLVARSGIALMPQSLFGRSFGELVVEYLQRWWIPADVRRRIVGFAIRAVHGDVTRLGFKRPAHRVHPTISATIAADIQFHRVAVRQGIERIDGRRIRFVDGSEEEFDALIAATGYDTAFPFLSPDIVPPGENRLALYRRIVAPGWPGLFFVGMLNLDTPINYACELQARWVVQVLQGRASLPEPQAMHNAIRAKQDWVERHYGRQMRHALQEESAIYYAELEYDLLRARHAAPLARVLAHFRGRPKARR